MNTILRRLLSNSYSARELLTDEMFERGLKYTETRILLSMYLSLRIIYAI